MPVDTRTILVAFGVDAAIGVGCATLFSILRIAKPTRSFYAPKRNTTTQDNSLPGHPRADAPAPPPLPLTLLTWVYPLMRIPERDIIRIAGLDVAIYLRLIQFGMLLCLFLSLWCLAVVLPINATGGELNAILAATASPSSNRQQVQLGPGQTQEIAASIASGTFTFSNFDKLSLANISPGSPRLWAHLVSVYVVTFITLRLLWHFSRAAIDLRFQFLAEQPVGGQSHAVLVTDIPGVPAGTFLDKLLWVLNHTFLRILPSFCKKPFERAWQHSFAAMEHVTKRTTPHLRRQFRRSVEGETGDSMLFVDPAPPPKAQSFMVAGEPVPRGVTSGASSSRSTSDAGVSYVYIARREGSESAPPIQQAAGAGRTSPIALSGTTCRQRSLTAKGAAALELPSRRTSAQEDSAAASDAALNPGTSASAAEHIRQHTLAALEGAELGGRMQDGQRDTGATSSSSKRSSMAAFRAAHDEWQRAAGQLCQGMTVQELVQLEYEQVYGADAVASVHPLRYSHQLAALDMQYSTAKQVLEDLINQYELQLLRGGRRPGLGVRLRTCWGDSLTRQLAHSGLPVVPIKLKQVPLNGWFTPAWARQRFQSEHGAPITEILAAPAVAADAESAAAARQQQNQLPLNMQQRQLPQLLYQQLHHLRQPTLVPSSTLQMPVSTADGYGHTAAAAAAGGGSEPPTVPAAPAAPLKRVDVLTYQLAWLQEIVSKIYAGKAAAVHVAQPSAFVTFRTRSDQVMAATTLQTTDESCWRMRPAPSPDDVLWNNLRLRNWEVTVRRQLLTGVLVVLVLFYAIPVGALQALLQLQHLEQVPVIGTIVRLPVIRSILLGVLPGLALRLFVLLLPVLLFPLNNHAGRKSTSDVDFAVATQYFVVQVFTVFISSFISGSALNQIQGIISNPSTILQTLGTGVPQTASFFVLYIIFLAFVGRSFALLRPFGVIIYIVQLSAAATSRARQRAAQAQYRMFAPQVPTHTIILLLALVFCVINPLILVAGLVSFCTAAVVERYGWVYAYRRWYESGGRMWRQIFNQVMTGVYFHQVVMLALLAVKRFPYAALLLPLILGTALLHSAAMRVFSRPWELLALRDARQLDMQDAAQASARFSDAGDVRSGWSVSSQTAEHEMRTAYVPPSFRINHLAELQELAIEVAAVQAKLVAHNEACGDTLLA